MDKWLWAVRVFKTRSLASQACRRGRVNISGQPVKPARIVRIDDVVVVEKDQIRRTLKVLRLLEHRVGAPAAPQYVEDQTPASEYEKARALNSHPAIFRPKGAGRPTKKDRRAIDSLY
jgi:ribosome-associated heat shock protein Hsp15